jgi:putative peptidoglycan lipid II flippase
MTVKLSRILMLTPIFFSLSYTVSGILNSYHRFFAYSLAPLFYNLAIILGVILLSERFGVYGVAWAVVFGAILHFLIQVPTLIKVGFRFRLSAFHRDPELKRILYLMIPRSVGLGTNQLTLFAFTAISSALAAGSIAVFTFADNIQTMPVVVFGTSLATVLFPTLSINAANNNKEDFLKYFYRAIKAILYMMTPLAVFFLIFSRSIVKIILDNGQFSVFDSVRASETLAAFCLAIVFESILTIIVRAFFAQKNTKIPMYASFISMIIAIFSGYLFSRHLGVPGLALGIALSNFFSVVFLFYFFHKKFISIDFLNLFSFFGRIIVASVSSGYIIFFVRKFTNSFLPTTSFLFMLTEIIIAFVIFGLIYIQISRILKVDELSLVFKKLLEKLNRQSRFDQGESGSNLERP